MEAFSRSVSQSSRRLGSAVAAVVVSNLDELVTVIGLVLVTVALWPSLERAALVVPGAVLVWIGMPVRKAFVHRTEALASREKESQ